MKFKRQVWQTMIGILLASTCGLVAKADYYEQINLVANDAKYNPQIVDETLLNAWGIAIRPAGLGGHFWVTSNGNSTSNQYVGDVGGTPLFMDDLALIDLPGVGDAGSTPTGVIFNQGPNFEITQSHANGDINAPAKFVFVGDDGTITAWTERNNGDGTIDRPLDAVKLFDGSAAGQAYFGSAVSANFDRLYAADFGTNPDMRVFDGSFNDITASVPFANPFDEEDGVAGLQPGDYAPFNVQTLGPSGEESLFVAYAKTQPDENNPNEFFAGEEDADATLGRLAEFDFDGNLIATWNDGGLLNAPWGFANAPSNFGPYSDTLLVTNFGDGTIVAFNKETRTAIDFVRDSAGEPIEIEGIWGITFGNGASLGELNHLYFAAGPADEEDGLFGKIVSVPEPTSACLLMLAFVPFMSYLRITTKKRT